MICEKCKPRELEAMRALESLTPNGSEFVNDPKRCVEFVQHLRDSQHQFIVKLTKERNALLEEVKRLSEYERRYKELGWQAWQSL